MLPLVSSLVRSLKINNKNRRTGSFPSPLVGEERHFLFLKAGRAGAQEDFGKEKKQPSSSAAAAADLAALP